MRDYCIGTPLSSGGGNALNVGGAGALAGSPTLINGQFGDTAIAIAIMREGIYSRFP